MPKKNPKSPRRNGLSCLAFLDFTSSGEPPEPTTEPGVLPIAQNERLDGFLATSADLP